MKKRVVFFITMIIICTSFLMFSNKIQATDKTLNSSIEVEKTEIKQGEETSIILKIDSDEQINAFQAKINYDSNIWEELDENSFETKKGWESLKYNKENNEFIVINKQEETNKEILKINFKAKNSANVGKTEITIDGITASDSKTEFENEKLSKEISIKVNESLIEKPSNPGNTIENTTGDNTNNTVENTTTGNITDNTVGNTTTENTTGNTVKNTTIDNTSNNTTENSDKNTINDITENNSVKNELENNQQNNIINSNKNNSTDESKSTNKTEENLPKMFPKTGASRTILLVIIILAILAIILYYKNKKIGKTMIMLIICGILISQSTVFAASEIFVGDINQSSVIDDEDIQIMQEYLIKSKSITSLEQADMNSDNKLSIMDLSLLIKQQKECPYDKNNVTNITSWSAVPMVSKELLKKQGVTTGGEGCQWPIGMAISKDGKKLLYGTDVGGVYRSEDGGKNWEQSNAGLQSRGVGAFSIDPKNPSYVVAVGINGSPFNTNGLYISEDGGKSWKFTKMMLIKGHRDIRESIAYDESSYNQEKNRCMVAYWSTAYETEDNYLEENEKGLYKTTDGGYTWNLVNNDLSDGTIKINPYTGDVYVSKKDGIYYSSNKGESFEKIIDDTITGLDLTAQKDQKINVYYCNNDGVYISKDGKTFEKIESTSYPTTEPMNIKVSPLNSNKLIIIDRQGTYQNYPYYSTDGGKTWKNSTLSDELSFMPYNNRMSIPMWSPINEYKVWIHTQGDYASSSTDSGKTFKWDSNGITGILSGGNVHYNVYNPDIIYFGSQDYDGCVTTDGGKTWKYISMSGYRWGGFCYGGYAVDENTYFVGVSDSWHNPRKLKITFDGGKTIIDTGMYFTKENINTGIESSYQSPTNPKVLFACDLRSEDGGHTWAKMDGCINVYTHNPKGQKELYGMDETGKYIVTSYDDGKTWKKVNNTEFIPNPKYASAHILDVAYDWKNEVAYAACEGGYLYKTSTKDGSVECVLNRYVEEYKRAPVNLKGGYSISKVAVDPIDPNIIYCGGAGNTFLNDCALYRSVDGGKSFQVVTSNTTNSIVKQGRQGGFETNSLEVNPKTGELLFAGGCFGIAKLSPPYKLNN